MGILKKIRRDTLEAYGFEFTKDNINNTLHDCWEQKIELSDTYTAWVSVDTVTSEFTVYIALSYGDEVACFDGVIDSKYHAYPAEFIAKLDEKVTDLTKPWCE